VVCAYRHQISFDGFNLWVSASDGVVLGAFPVGAGHTGIAFDGANIWVANTGGKTISKL
jgi:hypothetical protein